MSENRRSLNIVSCKAIKSGTNAKGREWTIYEVMATKPDGAPVELELRAFDPLPLGVGEFEVEKRVDPKYGDSYTLKIPGGGPRGPQVNPFEQRLAAVEQQMALLSQRVDELQAAGQSLAPLAGSALAAHPGTQF